MLSVASSNCRLLSTKSLATEQIDEIRQLSTLRGGLTSICQTFGDEKIPLLIGVEPLLELDQSVFTDTDYSQLTVFIELPIVDPMDITINTTNRKRI